MRVISGKYRFKRLYAPEGDSVRPTTDRIKETIFNVLQGYVLDSIVLDLFAGSGALGIEALSRGAAFADFVDVSANSLKFVNLNLEGVDKSTYNVSKSDFLAYLNFCDKKYDVIFVDAPYKSDMGQKAVDCIIERDILADGGVIVFEHDTKTPYVPTDTNNYKIKTKEMGNTTAEFIEKL